MEEKAAQILSAEHQPPTERSSIAKPPWLQTQHPPTHPDLLSSHSQPLLPKAREVTPFWWGAHVLLLVLRTKV